MRCAVSFLSVVILTVGVGVVGLLIIKWTAKEEDYVVDIIGSNSTNFSCPNFMWKCTEEDLCISMSSRCNNIKDCLLGSDEDRMNCEDMHQTVRFIMRNYKCGQDKNGNRTLSTAVSPIPEGCSIVNGSILCSNLKSNRIPWDGLDLHAKVLTLENALNITELRDQLIPPSETTISRVFVENGTILSLGESSVCNWNHACWISLENNSIQNIALGAFCNLPKLQWLTLSNNRITLENFRFDELPELQDLFLQNNRIEVIKDEQFRKLKMLVSLNLMGNKIRLIEDRAFRYNLNLEDLDLSNNFLKELPRDVFAGQLALKKLYLANNPFINIPGQALSPLQNLVSINLDGVDYSAIDFDALNNLPKLDYVQFKKFDYCRFLRKVSRCYPFSDGMSTIKNLLAGASLSWIVWLVATFTIVGNSAVLITRCLLGRRGRILDVFINNLAGADLLMGVYLIALAVKDDQYRNKYDEYAYEWSKSGLCTGIGIMAMISCEASLLILTFMSVERYLVISDPFSDQKKLSLNQSRISMTIIWIFVTLLAVAPAIQWRGKVTFYGSSGLCFPVHLDDPFAIGWEYTAFVIVGLNSVCLIIVAMSYSKLFCVIQTTRLSTPNQKKDIEMAVRFFLMVFTDCMCWSPIIIAKIYAFCGRQIPKEFIAWVVIFVLPINSTINPYLYTLSMPENRAKLFRRIIPNTSTFRQTLNGLILPLRRHGAGATITDVSRGTNWDNATLNTSGSEKIGLQIGGRLSYHESITSSKLEDTL